MMLDRDDSPHCLNPRCRAVLPPGKPFCPACGTKTSVEDACPSCGDAIDMSGRHCSSCGADLGGFRFSSQDIATWRGFFDALDWGLHHQAPLDKAPMFDMKGVGPTKRALERISKYIPLPGADQSEQWLFCIRHGLTPKSGVGGPSFWALGSVAASTPLKNEPMVGLRGWLIGTSRRFLYVSWDSSRFPECEINLPFDQISRIRCSENSLALPGLRAAWTIDILKGQSGENGLSLRWGERPTPKVLNSMVLAALGALVKAGTSVLESQAEKMKSGRAVMAEIERFFTQMAPSLD